MQKIGVACISHSQVTENVLKVIYEKSKCKIFLEQQSAACQVSQNTPEVEFKIQKFLEQHVTISGT